MDGFKSFLTSRTVWAALVGLIATFLQKYGYKVGVEDQTALVDGILTVVQFVSGVAVMYFRVKATKQITKAA
ncbi:hypothetical protein AMC83_CH01957 [Rhizobium phaseoli]|uniref:hypothetical protein n=1 Tax=Rhizobium phaseoli TaxID=396 RepID=UPI0007EBF17A|nr:hypothetical protein [Rhizobium phaseoli]ANL71940.1 hypothetical protein AMC83_CH01957 [Rhizobium phaseoli]